MASGCDQFIAKPDRLSGMQDFAVKGDPVVCFVGDDITQTLTNHICYAGVSFIRRVGNYVQVIAKRPVRAIDKFDYAKAIVHIFEQEPIDRAVGQERMGFVACHQRINRQLLIWMPVKWRWNEILPEEEVLVPFCP